MEIGVISDTHLGQVTDWLKRIIEEDFKDTDMILHAGDLVSGEVLEYLDSAGVLAVCGNMDLPEVTRALPQKRLVEAGPFRIGLIHGWGAPVGLAKRVRKEFDRLDCLVFGHSHWTHNSWVGSELHFNPGRCSGSGFGRKGSFGRLHLGDRITGEIITLEGERTR